MSVNSNLQPFLSTELTYRSVQETGAISDVKRLAPSKGMPLRFSKVIRGSYARLITYENTFLQEVHNNLPHARVVRRISDTDLSASSGDLAREIVTKDAGVDINKWYALPVSVDVNGTRQSYSSAFCHPVMLLNVTLHILKVFKGIHEAGIVHCDIKEDQICIPAKVVKTGENYEITPDFDNITLIDFGNALWDRVSIYKEYNPLPFNTAKALPYQSRKLIKASQHQQDYFENHGEYSFTQALKDVDYSVDLYSLGYMLQQMLEYHIKPNLSLSDPLTAIWSNVMREYESWLDELLQYNTGLIQSYSVSHIPHDDYINRVNHLIGLVGIPFDITFNTSISASVTSSTIEPTPVFPTPLLGEDTQLVGEHVITDHQVNDKFGHKDSSIYTNKEIKAEPITTTLHKNNRNILYKKKISKKVWIIIALVTILCCMFAFAFINNDDNTYNENSISDTSSFPSDSSVRNTENEGDTEDKPSANTLITRQAVYEDYNKKYNILFDTSSCNKVGFVSSLNSDDFLAVRQEPNSKATLLDKIHNNQKVYICKTNNKWHAIAYNKKGDCSKQQLASNECQVGWSHSKYINTNRPQVIKNALLDTSSCNKVGFVSSLNSDDFLAVRQEPNSKATLLDKIYNNQKVYICKTNNKWHAIAYNKKGDCSKQQLASNECQVGWSHSKYILIN